MTTTFRNSVKLVALTRCFSPHTVVDTLDGLHLIKNVITIETINRMKVGAVDGFMTVPNGAMKLYKRAFDTIRPKGIPPSPPPLSAE